MSEVALSTKVPNHKSIQFIFLKAGQMINKLDILFSHLGKKYWMAAMSWQLRKLKQSACRNGNGNALKYQHDRHYSTIIHLFPYTHKECDSFYLYVYFIIYLFIIFTHFNQHINSQLVLVKWYEGSSSSLTLYVNCNLLSCNTNPNRCTTEGCFFLHFIRCDAYGWFLAESGWKTQKL